MDWWYLFPLALGERLSGGAIWAVCLVGGVLVGAAPWSLRKRPARSAAVDASRCNACEQCYQDCPYEAIAMVSREDPIRRERYALEARVDPARCVSCGICVASCSSIGTDLPGFRLRDQRQRLATWLEDAGPAGEAAPGVAFVCALSAGAGLDVDAATGRCAELPGWRVLPCPCAGWVHTMTIERVLRRGAKRVLVVSCPPGSCHFREGPEWLAQRLDGTRPPALRTQHAARERIDVIALDRTRKAELVREAARLLGDGAPARRPEPGRSLAGVGAVLVALATSALLGVASDWSYAAPAAPGSELVVTFKHPGRRSEVCRTRSAEELERLPVHMRQAEVCERARAPVRLRVSLDGALAIDEVFEPKGLWNDGSSVAVRALPVAAGERRVRVEIGDGPDANEWNHRTEQLVAFDERTRRVVAFDRASGFTLY
jgi:coenzyme F420-reducing hydrogenase delta subunit/Pyruvate/2-oxoacid:ferredoxin oxidoreductase delta subunit